MAGNIEITNSPDLTQLVLIYNACFELDWNEKAFTELLAIKGTFAVLAFENKGFGLVRIIADEAEIITLAVLPEFRKQGIANLIVMEMLELARKNQAKSIFLEVKESNNAARGLYNKCGFKIIAKRKAYYQNPRCGYEDAMLMKKELN